MGLYYSFQDERYLENQIRKAFDFTGTPIHLIKRTRKQKYFDELLTFQNGEIILERF